MSTKLTLFNMIIILASFLTWTISSINSYPNGPSIEREARLAWTPWNSQDEVKFQGPSSHKELFFDEPTELEEGKEKLILPSLVNTLEDDDEVPLGENLISNNKRNPNSQQFRTYKNRAGFYLVQGPNNQVMGTPSTTECDQKGVFISGKQGGIPFIKNKASNLYLAINSSGQVYMTANQGPDTAIRSVPAGELEGHLYLYRKTDSKRYFLDISQSTVGTVGESEVGETATFRVRYGKTCS